jgi:hypothetical protein
MPLTVSLGAELLNLSSPALDALATLQANLATARFELSQLADEEIGMLRVAQVVKMHGHNMEILAQCFERIAPTRSFQMLGADEPQLASTILWARARALLGL